jgi:hypothetical protein
LPLKNPSFEGLLFEERLFYERRLALRGAAWPIHRAVSHCGRIAGGLEVAESRAKLLDAGIDLEALPVVEALPAPRAAGRAVIDQ